MQASMASLHPCHKPYKPRSSFTGCIDFPRPQISPRPQPAEPDLLGSDLSQCGASLTSYGLCWQFGELNLRWLGIEREIFRNAGPRPCHCQRLHFRQLPGALAQAVSRAVRPQAGVGHQHEQRPKPILGLCLSRSPGFRRVMKLCT